MNRIGIVDIGGISDMDRTVSDPRTISQDPDHPNYQHYNSTPNTPLRRPLKIKRKLPKIHAKSRSRPSKLSTN